MPSAVPVAVSASGPLPVARWAGLGGLMLAELLLLTTRFDTGVLTGDGRWWAPLLGEAHYLPQLALTVAVALVLFGGERMRKALIGVVDRVREPHTWAAPLAIHAIGFGLFVLFTARLLEGSGAGTAAFIGWIGAGCVMLAGWCLTVMPWTVWRKLFGRSGWFVLSAVSTAGLLGFGAGRMTEPLWDRMADLTLGVVRTLLEVGYTDVACDPGERTIGVGSFVVGIAPACSGYEGLGLVAAFAGLFVVLRRDELRFPNALLLLPLGLVAAWLANVLRIAGLIALGAGGWPEIALGGFHSQAGWLGFNAVALGLVVVGRRSRFFARDAVATESNANPAAPYLAPLIAVVGCAMLTGAISADGFDTFYGVRVVAAAVVIVWFRKEYAQLGWLAKPGFALGIGSFVFAVWIGLTYGFGVLSEESPISTGLAALPGWMAAGWVALRIVGAVVVVPLAEELAFRGYLLRRLQSSEFDRVPASKWSWPAVLASSVVFGLLHPGWWIAGTVAGVCYAAAYCHRGRLADAVVAHAVTNALLAAFVLTTGSWFLW